MKTFNEHIDPLLKSAEYHRQETDWTCGPSAVRPILAGYGVDVDEPCLARVLHTNSDSGTDGDRIEHLFKVIGFETRQTNGEANTTDGASAFSELTKAIANGWSVIVLYWNNYETPHFATVSAIDDQFITIVDPMFGPARTYAIADFEKIWHTEVDDTVYPFWMLAVRNQKPNADRMVNIISGIDPWDLT